MTQDPECDPELGAVHEAAAGYAARRFHEIYESLAPYISAEPWEDVPVEDRRLMERTVSRLANEGVIFVGPAAFAASAAHVSERGDRRG